MAIVNKFNVNKQEVTLDVDIIENMSANDLSYNASTQYDENTVGDKLSELESEINGEGKKTITPSIGSNTIAEIDVNEGDTINISAIASTPLTASSYIMLYMNEEHIYSSKLIGSSSTQGSIPPFNVTIAGKVVIKFGYNEYTQNTIDFIISPAKKVH